MKTTMMIVASVMVATISQAIDAPTNLRVSGVPQSDAVVLRWRDNSQNETGFIVRTREHGEHNWRKEVAAANTRRYVVRELKPGTAYDFRVAAFNLNKQSPWSNIASATTLPAPDTEPPVIALVDPLNGAVIWGDGFVEVVASDNVGVVRVDLFIDGTQVGTSSTDPFTIAWSTETVSDGVHALSVKAMDAAGNTGTATVSITVDNLLPAPGNLQATAIDHSRIDITWTDTSTNEDGFEIQRAPAPEGPWTTLTIVGRNVTSFSDMVLTPSTPYCYRVRACRGCNPATDL